MTGTEVIAFLKHLLRRIPGPIVIVWDKHPIHGREGVKDFLAGHPRLQVYAFPTAAPELNPTEYIWGHLKHHELANRCAADFRYLKTGARNRLRSMQRRPILIRAFWRQAELQF